MIEMYRVAKQWLLSGAQQRQADSKVNKNLQPCQI